MTLVPEPHDIRASDAEREAVADAVRDHAAAGRIDADELEARLERTYGARLRADLAPIVADLPSLETAPRPRRSLPRVAAIPPVLAIAVLLIAIWAVTGAGYFWPMWPIAAIAFSSLKGHRAGCFRRSASHFAPRA